MGQIYLALGLCVALGVRGRSQDSQSCDFTLNTLIFLEVSRTFLGFLLPFSPSKRTSSKTKNTTPT